METIRDFHADIQVQTDGSVIVTEKITVYREGKQIRRGIYRSLPKTRGVTYSVLSVKRDGKPEPYFTEKARRFFTINTGNDTFLPHDGLYTFEITYQASNVILSFKNHDELYWNVTGNEWSFPIERASVEVVLPDGAEIRQTSSYIGFLGSKEAGLYLSEKNVFSAPRSLKQREGLTIAVGFDKGFVEATRFPLEQFAQYAALILGSYMLVTWFLFGRDPPQDVIVPRFRGPSGLTPALAGWIYSCGHNKEGCLAAALLQGGLSGFLHIKYNNGLLKVTKAREAKNGEEKTFERYMTFPLVVVDKYSPKLERFMLDFSEFLEQKAGEKYFTANTFLVFFGCVLMLALTTGLSFFAQAPYLSIIMGAYLIFSVPLGKRFLKGIVTKKFPYASFWTLFVIFLHFCATTLNVIDENPETKTVILFYVLSGFALIVYSYLIIRPTYEGMRIIAHLDGIKMFLKTVEPTLPDKVDFNSMEELLPYAFLLGLEKEWEAKIKLVAGTAYQPQWFKGHFSMNGFGNLHATLSKAGIRPIRSGLGGRGFSGGGFGGGGGGGR
ncbi:MAG: DUF2207 domain-containing protein [Alphaproteobacteria bacterium]|nr:DUF2207 domain-containing protein [Alphaproteobacteria bacterium]